MATLKEQRIKNFIDATSFVEPDKVPVGIEVITWPFVYGGKTYADVMYDPEGAAKAYLKFLDDMPLDCIILGAGVSFRPTVSQALGNYDYVMSRDGVCVQHAQAEASFMTTEDYDAFINDFKKFTTDTFKRRKYPSFTKPKKEAYEDLKKAAKEMKIHLQMNGLISKGFEDKEIIPTLAFDMPGYGSPLNTLFDNFRGMKDTMLDIRRRPAVVRKACEVIAQNTQPPINPDDYEGRNYPMAATVYHSECFLNRDLYDEFYFSGFKKRCLPLMEKGVKYFLKGEGHFLNTVDRFKELPKGSVLMMLDEDDPFEIYKVIGDHQALATGIPVDLLKVGSKQQCIDYVKKCFDTFAPGGGFVFCPNKPLLCANDTKIENLLAVYQFADEYGKKR